MSKKLKYSCKIKGLDWSFQCQSQLSYTREHGKDSDAITYTHEKEVYFNKAKLLPSTVRHELLHCYVASSGINSASLTADQMEEICAEIFEHHAMDMNTIVDKILEHFLR